MSTARNSMGDTPADDSRRHLRCLFAWRLVSRGPAHRSQLVSLSPSLALSPAPAAGRRGKLLAPFLRPRAPLQGSGRVVSSHRDGCVATPFVARGEGSVQQVAARSASTRSRSESLCRRVAIASPCLCWVSSYSSCVYNCDKFFAFMFA